MGRNLHHLAEERSIELHRAVASMLAREPSLLQKARDKVVWLVAQGTMHADYGSQWLAIFDRPLPEVCALLVDPSEQARALRQSSPFAGFLDPRTRFEIHRKTLEDWSRREP